MYHRQIPDSSAPLAVRLRACHHQRRRWCTRRTRWLLASYEHQGRRHRCSNSRRPRVADVPPTRQHDTQRRTHLGGDAWLASAPPRRIRHACAIFSLSSPSAGRRDALYRAPSLMKLEGGRISRQNWPTVFQPAHEADTVDHQQVLYRKCFLLPLLSYQALSELRRPAVDGRETAGCTALRGTMHGRQCMRRAFLTAWSTRERRVSGPSIVPPTNAVPTPDGRRGQDGGHHGTLSATS